MWDRLLAAGARYGIRPVGYRVLDSLRMEKGYRAFGSDLTAGDTPDEAGLGFCVALERKGDFVGRAAVEAQRARGIERRLRTLLVGDGAYACVYGGEAVVAGGTVVGRVRSAAYGFTVGQMIASAYLPRELAADAPLSIEVLGASSRPKWPRTRSTMAEIFASGHRDCRRMLMLLPNCECCDRDLPPESEPARICTYECTFCADCAEPGSAASARTAAASSCAARSGRRSGCLRIRPRPSASRRRTPSA